MTLQVLQRIETVMAAAPPLSGGILDGLQQAPEGLQSTTAALPTTPLISGALAPAGAPTAATAPTENPLPVLSQYGTADAPAVSSLHQALGAPLSAADTN